MSYNSPLIAPLTKIFFGLKKSFCESLIFTNSLSDMTENYFEILGST